MSSHKDLHVLSANFNFSICQITVFPIKPGTPEKICWMFIVLRPIRCEMKPQKVTAKPQQLERFGLVTTWHETMLWLFFYHDKISILPFSNLFHVSKTLGMRNFCFWTWKYSLLQNYWKAQRVKSQIIFANVTVLNTPHCSIIGIN